MINVIVLGYIELPMSLMMVSNGVEVIGTNHSQGNVNNGLVSGERINSQNMIYWTCTGTVGIGSEKFLMSMLEKRNNDWLKHDFT